MAMNLEDVEKRLEELAKFLEQCKNEQQQLIGYRARLMEESQTDDDAPSDNHKPKEQVKAKATA
jgi:hypothetical protein